MRRLRWRETEDEQIDLGPDWRGRTENEGPPDLWEAELMEVEKVSMKTETERRVEVGVLE